MLAVDIKEHSAVHKSNWLKDDKHTEYILAIHSILCAFVCKHMDGGIASSISHFAVSFIT